VPRSSATSALARSHPRSASIAAATFVGHRAPLDRDLPADLPYGVRIDMQLGDEQSIVVSASLDTAPLVLLLGGIIVAASSASH
jgi:hypothetical protein